MSDNDADLGDEISDVASDVVTDEEQDEGDELEDLGIDVITPINVLNKNDSALVIVVPNDERKCSDILSIFEISNIISTRAQQISNGSPIFVVSKSINPIDIAKQELMENKCPLNLSRTVKKSSSGNITIEIWNPNEMTKSICIQL